MPEYRCQPVECVSSPKFQPVNWTDDATTYYPPTDGFFNLAPIAFGLSYDIFEIEFVTKKIGKNSFTTFSTGNWESQTALTSFDTTMLGSSITIFDPDNPIPTHSPAEYAGGSSSGDGRRRRSPVRVALLSSRDLSLIFKRGGDVLPAVCFDTCNNAFLEAQNVGKTPDLCNEGSAFRGFYDGCNACIDRFEEQEKLEIVRREYLEPSFEQFVEYCEIGVGIPIKDDLPEPIVTTPEPEDPEETETEDPEETDPEDPEETEPEEPGSEETETEIDDVDDTTTVTTTSATTAPEDGTTPTTAPDGETSPTTAPEDETTSSPDSPVITTPPDSGNVGTDVPTTTTPIAEFTGSAVKKSLSGLASSFLPLLASLIVLA